MLAIYWLLAIVYVGATRFLARSWFRHAERQRCERKRIAIYGAGSAGTQLAYALRAGKEYWPVLFFDDNPALQKTEVAGLRVHAASGAGGAGQGAADRRGAAGHSLGQPGASGWRSSTAWRGCTARSSWFPAWPTW